MIRTNNIASAGYTNGSYGMQVVMAENMPDIRQSDFVRDLMNRFNLIILNDAENTDNLIIEPYQDYINGGTTQYWTDKLDMSKTTDRGELYKVMATTFGIIEHYLTAKDAGQPYGIKDEMAPFQMHMNSNTDNPPDMLRIEPTKEKIWDLGTRDDDKRREKLYMQYLKKQGYKARVVGDTIVVDISEYIK